MSCRPLHHTEIQKCIIQCNLTKFLFGDDTNLDGIMLDKAGVIECNLSVQRLNICPECYGFLKHSKIPCLALPNNLYRGILPDLFRDLTWVGEMVCAIY